MSEPEKPVPNKKLQESVENSASNEQIIVEKAKSGEEKAKSNEQNVAEKVKPNEQPPVPPPAVQR